MAYQHRKTCLKIALAASVVGGIVSAFKTGSAGWSILSAVLILLACVTGVALGDEAMRRTGTRNEGDYMEAETIGCGIGLLIAAALSAGLIAIFSGG